MAKILLIEDDSILRKAYATILIKHGHDVTEAANGQQGLDKANQFNPDIIILDLIMPRMNGVEFLKAYNLANHKNVKVLVFSNSSQPDMIEEVKKLGAHKYLIKAIIPPKDIVTNVQEVLKS